MPVLHVEDAGRDVAWYERLKFQTEWEHQFEPGFPWFVSIARGSESATWKIRTATGCASRRAAPEDGTALGATVQTC